MATKAKFESAGFELEFTNGEWIVSEGVVKVSGARISNGSCLKTHSGISFQMDFRGVNVNEIAEDAARTQWIRLQGVRDKGDSAVEQLNNATIHVNDIGQYVSDGRIPNPVKLAEKLSRDQLAELIEKMQAELLKKA